MGPRLQPMLLTRSVLMQVYHFNYEDRFLKALKLSTWVKEARFYTNNGRV
jgi:hypothetical protein